MFYAGRCLRRVARQPPFNFARQTERGLQPARASHCPSLACREGSSALRLSLACSRLMRLAAFTASPRDSAFTASLTDSFPKLSFSLCTAKKGLHAAPAALNRTGRAAEANPRPGPAPDHTATDRRVQSGARPGQLHRREQERERERRKMEGPWVRERGVLLYKYSIAEQQGSTRGALRCNCVTRGPRQNARGIGAHQHIGPAFHLDTLRGAARNRPTSLLTSDRERAAGRGDGGEGQERPQPS